MQTVVGNLTATAKISTTKDGRKVVNFTIGENTRFKVKGSDQVKKVTSFYNCSYWIGTGIAAHLKKGRLIEVAGRIGVNAWANKEGEPQAGLTLHVQFIRLHGKGNTPTTTPGEPVPDNTVGDLPF